MQTDPRNLYPSVKADPKSTTCHTVGSLREPTSVKA